MPTWKELCPLDGTCSECGLGFAWADVMSPGRVFPRWSFEHARGVSVRRGVGTFFRTFSPGRFWMHMRLEALIKPRRLILFALVVVLLAYLAITVMWGVNGYVAGLAPWMKTAPWAGTRVPGGFVGPPWGIAIEAALRPFGRGGNPYTYIPPPIAAPAAAFVLWCLLIPIPFLLLGTSMRRARCRRAHLWRAWVYFLPTPAVMVLASAAFWTAGYIESTRGSGMIYSIMDATWLLCVPVMAWCVWWWYVLVSRYLRLEHPKSVTSLLLLSSLLMAIAVVAYLPGGGLINDVGWLIHRYLY